LLLWIFTTSCNDNTEVNNYFKYVESNSSLSEINSFKNIAEDSIFHIHSEMIPSFIHDNYKNYSKKSELSAELKSNFNVQSEYIEREILMMLFHINLNGERLSQTNLENHRKHYQKTNLEQEKKDSIKLINCIVQNFEKHNHDDLIEVIFDVELDEYDKSRHMTYPSVYHMTNPKERFEDSLVIQGKLLRKGNYPDFPNEVEIVNRMNPLMFEIEMTEINDTSISIAHKGPTEKLRVGEIFYIDLEGC